MNVLKLFLRNSKFILLFILNILLFSGCITIHTLPDDSKIIMIGRGEPPEEPQANYSELSLEDKQKIVTLEDFNNVDYEKINKINGSQLREQLKKDSIVLVGLCNTCTASAKYPDNWGYPGEKLYLVMQSYTPMYYLLRNETRPIFSIDMEYYNTEYHKDCLYYFVNDLLGRDLDEKFYNDVIPSFLYFRNGKLVSTESLHGSSTKKRKKYDDEISYEQLLKEQQEKEQ